MKRFVALILSFMLFALSLAGCNVNKDEADAEKAVRIAGMKGPTSIGLVGVMEENDGEYDFSIEATADAIVPKLVKGDLDIAAVPANLAATLYNNTDGEIQILAVNTLGVLYVVSKGEEISSVADLKGKTIITTGKGTTPEYTLKYILAENGLTPGEDVTIDFKSEAAEVVAALTKAESGVAMLPQPFATIALGKVSGLSVALDLDAEWRRINPESAIVTGVLVVRREFAEKNGELLKDFLSQYKASVEAVNASPSNAAELVVKYGIFDNAQVIEKAIPKCNITFISGEDMVSPVNKYLGVLYEQNEKSVGGKLPDENFFYIP